MFPTHQHPSHSIWSVQDDRDLSRAAAERHFLLSAAAESQPTATRRSSLRRLLTAGAPSALAPRGADA